MGVSPARGGCPRAGANLKARVNRTVPRGRPTPPSTPPADRARVRVRDLDRDGDRVRVGGGFRDLVSSGSWKQRRGCARVSRRAAVYHFHSGMSRPLRLAALRLDGFKSFADAVELRFPGAIAAIVGPNGAGKSNLADAIAWVLGEQSARLLRSQTMADVIFAGSPNRPPAGSAEVVLTLASAGSDWEETDGRLEISRRVLRDGTSDYRLGGRRVRLKDISDRLFDAGLGTRAYAIIEQGRIGQVLSLRATDRRALFEEAAGISKYRVRRHEAELKLAETRANLLRINDVIAEVRRALEAARRQARRAEKHRRLRRELAEVRGLLFAARLQELNETLRQRQCQLNDAVGQDAQLAAALAAAEVELASRRASLDRTQQALATRQAELATLDAAVSRREAEERAAAGGAAEAQARRQACLDEARRVAAAAAELGTRSESLAAALVAAQAAAATAREEAAHQAEALEAMATAARRASAAAEDGRRRLLSAVAAAAEARNRWHRLEVEGEQAAMQRQRLEREEARLSEHLARIAERETQAHQEEQAALAQTQAAEEAVRLAQHQLAADAVEIAKYEAARDHAAHRRRELQHEVEHLEARMAQARALPQALARAVRETDVLGVVSDFLDPAPELTPLLDRAWGDALSLPVLASRQALAEIPRHLSGEEGTVEVVVADPTLPPRPSPLLDAAGVSPQQRGWLSHALPPARLAASEEEALALVRQNPDLVVLLPDGSRWRGARVEFPGSRRKTQGVLELRARWREAHAQLASVRAEEESATAQLAAARERQAAGRAALTAAEDTARRAAQAAATTASTREGLHREHVRLEKELEALRFELLRLQEDQETLARRRRDAAAEAERLAALSRAAEKEMEILVAAAERAREQEAAGRAAAERAAGAAALAEERVGARERELAHHRRELERLARRQEELQRQAAEAEERAAAAHAAIAQARADLRQLLSRNTDLQREVARAAAELEESRAAAVAAEREVAARRHAHLQAREQVHAARLASAEVESALVHLQDTIAMTLGDTPLPEQPPAPEHLPALQAREKELERELEEMGPVNELAVSERDELEKRFAFLSEQRRDLERSLASLADTVRELDATCAARFVATLQEVGEAFAAVFRELFGGGEAHVELSDPDHPLDSGVEIRVRPPGKHTQSVLLLSGGEKALAAVALLIGLFRVRPAPFCVLDEVDAPLDDANVERLCRLLREMSRDTQFVLITHNRRTMAHADVLYGVTMEEPGVSRLVSVRLEE